MTLSQCSFFVPSGKGFPVPDFSLLEIILMALALLFFSSTAALLLFGGKAVKQEVEIAIHKWATDFGATLAKIGLSTNVTAPFTDLGAGDDAGALGSGIAAAR